MDNHSTSELDEPTPEHIAKLEAALADIENGFFHQYLFTSKTLIQTTFPHSAKSGKEITLINGDTHVTMYSRHGLPYGMYPRLIMIWLTREALRRSNLPVEQARRIPLSNNVAKFLREMGIKVHSGGENGTKAALKKQMLSLFSTSIGRDIYGYSKDRKAVDLDNAFIGKRAHLWWDEVPKGKKAGDYDEEFVILSTDFYRDLIQSVVPLDPKMVMGLRRSPFALDMYCWLTYRVSYLKYPTVVTWDQLRGQFGVGYPNTRYGRQDFKKNAKRAMEKVKTVWPEASAYFVENGLLLRPGNPSVPRKVHDEAQDLSR